MNQEWLQIWTAGFLVGFGLSGLILCLAGWLRFRNMTILDPKHSALVFSDEGVVTMVLPKHDLDADVPSHMLITGALGARLIADKDWSSHVVTEARDWFVKRLNDGAKEKGNEP